jgi:hypothetical protein
MIGAYVEMGQVLATLETLADEEARATRLHPGWAVTQFPKHENRTSRQKRICLTSMY